MREVRAVLPAGRLQVVCSLMVGERANAAFAQDHVVVAFGHYVFSREQELIERRRHSAFEHHRLARLPNSPQQREVLHVARSDLHDVRVFFDQVSRFRVQHFSHDAEPESITRLRENLQSIFAQA